MTRALRYNEEEKGQRIICTRGERERGERREERESEVLKSLFCLRNGLGIK